jgi:sigma-B regulation protein RsbU (phosphoserine phosphatase)
MNQSAAECHYEKNEKKGQVLGKDALSVLRAMTPEHITGNIIGKIASSHYYVTDDAQVSDLADDLLFDDSIMAVGVVEKETGHARGIIRRDDLFDMLGKKFGRELYSYKSISEVIIEPQKFHYRSSIVLVTEAIGRHLNNLKTDYYLLVDRNNRFTGIFSSKDLLKYLSDLMQADMFLAKTIQQQIVKEMLYNRYGGCEIVAASRMAQGVGGDFYSVTEQEDNKILLAVCDVSGKGMSAAMISMLLGGTMMYYDFKKGVRDYIKKLNSYIHEYLQNERYITAAFLVYDPKTGVTELFDFGHSYTYLLRGKKFKKIHYAEESIPLGVSNSIEPRSLKFKLKPDDLLVIITDGFEDQKNHRGKVYGMDNMLKSLIKNSGKGLKDICQDVYNEVDTFRENQAQIDDMTLLLLKCTEISNYSPGTGAEPA